MHQVVVGNMKGVRVAVTYYIQDRPALHTSTIVRSQWNLQSMIPRIRDGQA